MQKPLNIEIDNYTYDLPEESIAKYPLKERDASKLMVYNQGEIIEEKFLNLTEYLPENSLLVQNNTKVIRARMEFKKETGARIEVFCLEPHSPADYNLCFSQTENCTWQCIVGNSKKWKSGSLSKMVSVNGESTKLKIERIEQGSTSQLINFSWDNNKITFSELLEHSGNIPIPPYLKRESEKSDLVRYQTIYSKHKGSVAAPTAGLHFTQQVFDKLAEKNIQRHEVTLHVGAGTFKPVQSKTIGEHEMHTEQFIISDATIKPLIKNLGKITAVGTTTMRTLESLYWLGVKLIQHKNTMDDWHLKQWEAYELPSNVSPQEALAAIDKFMRDKQISQITASTSIFIAPGYSFKMVDNLVTNFHQPQSTLLLLIAAFIGEDWIKMYDFAKSNNFRFLSYGDSCLLKPSKA